MKTADSRYVQKQRRYTAKKIARKPSRWNMPKEGEGVKK